MRGLTPWATLQMLVATGHRAARAARPLLVARGVVEPRFLAQGLLSALRLFRDGREDRAVDLIADIPQFRSCYTGQTLYTQIV